MIHGRYFWMLGQIHAEADVMYDRRYGSQIFIQRDLCEDGEHRVSGQ